MRGGIWKPLLISYVLILSVLIIGSSDRGSGMEDYTGDHIEAFVTTSGSLSLSQPDIASFTLDPYYDGEWRQFRLDGLIGRLNGTGTTSLNLSIMNRGEEGGYIDSMVVIDYGSDEANWTNITFPRCQIDVKNDAAVEIKLIPENMECGFRNINEGSVRLMLRQEAKPKFIPVVQIGSGSYLSLPYDRDYLIARAGDDMVVRAGMKVGLNGDAYNPMERELTYRWDFGLLDGLIWDAEGSSVEYTYHEEGRYVITLNVSDGTQYSHDCINISVFPSLPPVAVSGGDRTVNRNEMVRFDASGSYDDDGDPLTFKWILPDGSVEPRIEFTKRFADPGVYRIMLIVTDGFHESNTTLNVTVINRPPEVLYISYGIARIGHPMTFNASTVSDPEGDELQGFLWDFGDGSFGEGRIVEHTYLESRDIVVKLSVFDGYDNGTGQTEFWIPENNGPTAVAKDRIIHSCVGKATYFFSYDSTDPEDHPLNYTWDFGNGGIGYGSFAKHTYWNQGTYNATLTVRDIVGDESTDVSVVVVHDRERYYPDETRINSIFSRTDGVLPSTVYYLLYNDPQSGETYRIYREEGGFRTYILNLPEETWYEVHLKVVEGWNVDILLLTSDQYEDYLTNHGDAVDWIQDGTSLWDDDWTFHIQGGETIYIVIDNNDKIPNGASPRGSVLFNLTITESDYEPPPQNGNAESEVQTTDPLPANCLCGLINAILLIVIIIPIYLAVRTSAHNKQKDKAIAIKESIKTDSRPGRSGYDPTNRSKGKDNEGIRRDIRIEDLKAGRVKNIPDLPPEQQRMVGNILRIPDKRNRKDESPVDTKVETDFLGSTDIDAIVYEDEEFDLKQTEEWQKVSPARKQIRDSGEEMTDTGSDDDSGPRLARPPPDW